MANVDLSFALWVHSICVLGGGEVWRHGHGMLLQENLGFFIQF